MGPLHYGRIIEQIEYKRDCTTSFLTIMEDLKEPEFVSKYGSIPYNNIHDSVFYFFTSMDRYCIYYYWCSNCNHSTLLDIHKKFSDSRSLLEIYYEDDEFLLIDMEQEYESAMTIINKD